MTFDRSISWRKRTVNCGFHFCRRKAATVVTEYIYIVVFDYICIRFEGGEIFRGKVYIYFEQDVSRKKRYEGDDVKMNS